MADSDLLHTQTEACFFESCPCEACNAHPHKSPRTGNADLRKDCPESVHPDVLNALSRADCASFVHLDAFLEARSARSSADFANEEPQAQTMAASDTFAHLNTLCDVPKAGPCANVSGFAHPHAISAGPNAPGRADCTDSAHPDTLSEGTCAQAKEKCTGSAYLQENFEGLQAESSPVYSHTCNEFTHLQGECADSTQACGNNGGFTCLHTGPADLCDEERGVACTRGDTTRWHEGIQVVSTTQAFPCVEGSRYSMRSVLSKPQPCVSECSSAASTVSDAISESTRVSSDATTDTEFTETRWTDAKHRSYLTFMEANFVKVLYGREYCALNICGQAPCTPGSCSFPWPSTLFEFKSGQSGEWHRKSMPDPACIPSALINSPRVNHFWRHNSANASDQIKVENARVSNNMDEGEEVDSPSTFTLYAEESQKGNWIRRHSHAPRNLEEKHMSKDGGSNDDMTGHSTSFPTRKKRGFQPDCEQKPSMRHKREPQQLKN